MFKKLFSFLIVLSMTLVLFTGVQISVSAEILSGGCGSDGKTDNTSNVTWSLDTDSGVLKISGTGDMCNYIGVSATSWYNNRESIRNVIITDSVTSIANYAFSNCSSLTSVTISDDVTSIGDRAFVSCSSLTSVTIPDSVTSIDYRAFAACSKLETVFYPAENCTVHREAFYNTPATQIKYTDNNDGKFKITDITLGEGKEPVVIDTSKYTYDETDKNLMKKIAHTHTGGTATCEKKAECTLCGTEYGELAAHNYENGECTVCHTPDPNTGGDDNNNDDSISLEKDGNTLTISGTGAVNSDDLSAVGGKESITDVVIEDGINSVGDNAFDGFTNLETVTIPDSVEDIGDNAFDDTKLDIVYYESGAGVEESDFPAGATQVEYSVNEDGKIIIESIKQGDVISEDGKIVIPDKIGGMDVAGAAEEVKPWVSAEGHEHKGGTATCSALAVCSICASEYGELDPDYHTYVNGVCTGCSAADPNGGSQGTTPTAPPNPSVPSRPTAPSTPVVTPNVTTATETTAKTDEEIIADDNYTGEDISSGAGDDSDDGGITDMSMVVIVIAMAAVIAAAVLIKKLIF